MTRAARKSMAVIASGRMTVTKVAGAGTCCFGTAGSGRHVRENLLLLACSPLSLNFIVCLNELLRNVEIIKPGVFQGI